MLVYSLAQVAKDTSQKVSEMISQNDVLELLNTTQSLFSNQTQFIIGVTGIIITVFGIMLPIFQYFNNRKSERYIRNEIEKFDKRIERTIKAKIQDEFDRIINEKTELLKNEINIEINKLDSYHKGSNAINRAREFEENGNYIRMYTFVLQALFRFIESERIKAINTTFNLVNKLSIKLLKIEQKEIKYPLNLTKDTYLSKIIELTNGKKEYEEIMKRFISTYKLVNNIDFDENEDDDEK